MLLQLLRIKNLALVEDLEWEIAPGFTAITGETGAGKSILVEAVAFVRHRTQAQEVGAPCHHAPTPQHRIARIGLRVVRRRRLGSHLGSNRAG